MRFGLRAATRRLDRLWPSRTLHGPSWVILGVNNACNLRCRMCDVGTGEDSVFLRNMTGAEPGRMPLALAARIVDQVATSWPRAKLAFAFTEPSTWPPLVEAVGLAARRGLFSSVTTNGLLLPGLAEPLAAAGLAELVVSLDGPPEVHDLIRGRAGSHARAMEGLRRVLAAPKRPRVAVYCALSQWNLGRLEEFLAGLPPGLDRVGFMHTVYVGAEAAAAHNRAWPAYVATPSNTSQLDLEAYDLDALWAEMGRIGAAARPWPLQWSPTLRSRAELEAYYRGRGRWGRRCADAWETLLVKADGRVIPAHSRCYELVAGNVQAQDLAEIWHGPVLARFRADLAAAGGLFPGCDRCCSAR